MNILAIVHFRVTIWKLQKFSATQILREINLRILEVQNQAFLAYLEALNLNEFLHFLMAKF